MGVEADTKPGPLILDSPSSLSGLNTVNGSQRMVLEAFTLSLTE